MTTIDINMRGQAVTVTGHAGYAEAGKDIVCAAVSALCWTLAATLHHAGALLEATEEDGRMEIRWAGEVDEYLDMFSIGAEMIEQKYPDHVRVQGRNSLLFDDTIDKGVRA